MADKRERPVVRYPDGKVFASMQMAASVLGVNRSCLYKAIRDKTRCGGYLWARKGDPPPTARPRLSKPLIRVKRLEDGKVYDSVKDACLDIFVTQQHFYRQLRGNRPCGGYTWEKVDA